MLASSESNSLRIKIDCTNEPSCVDPCIRGRSLRVAPPFAVAPGTRRKRSTHDLTDIPERERDGVGVAIVQPGGKAVVLADHPAMMPRTTVFESSLGHRVPAITPLIG